ncbi:MAG: elongation factor G [Fidelibacterota bacterium]
MKEYKTENIINFALCGHSTTGKTTLAEALLFNAGEIKRLGTIDDGNTISDYHEDEIEHKHSITSSLMNFEWLDKKFNMIDTPGYLEFHGEAKAALRVADFAAIVINGSNGVEVGTELVWDYAKSDYNIPRLLIVNFLDRDNTDFDRIIDEAKDRFGNKVFPITVPMNHGENFNQIADVLRKEIYTYETDGTGNYKESNPSGEWADKLDALHEQLIELIAESDDTLLELFFENGELTEDQLRGGLHQAFLTGELVPVFCVAGKRNVGVKRMMDVLSRYAPSASDIQKINGTKPGTDTAVTLSPTSKESTSAFVFKTVSEPHIGELSFFRVYSGEIRGGDDLDNTSRNSTEKIRQVFTMNGKTRKDASSLIAGDIGTAVKLKNTHTGDTLSASAKPIELAGIKYPSPNMRMAILPKAKGDEEKISEGLSTIHEEDPTFQYTVDPELKQTIISGQGELHLKMVMKRLKDRYHVELDMIPPKIPYRETIMGKSEAKYRHKKQSGGAGQFAEVWLRVEPKPRGEGVEIINSLVGQNVDRVYVTSVEKGVNAVCDEGILAGCRVVDLKVDFYDGKMHPVDSNDISFQIAGKHAFIDAFLQAKPKLLEPIYTLVAKVPDSVMGDVMGDISQRRGRVQGMESDGHYQIITAEVPLVNLHDYSTSLRSMSQGRGIFSIEFARYEDLPANEAEKVMEEYKARREQGN